MLIREMNIEDIAPCAAIEARDSLTPWNETGLFSYFLREDTAFFVAEEAGEVIGLCALLLIPEEAEILLLTVAEEHRRKGAASALLRAQEAAAKERGICKFFLEVREGNHPARSLYEKEGYFEIGRRKNYYDGPVEDAVTMAKEI